MMASKTISIKAENSKLVVESLKARLEGTTPKMILFFASSVYKGIEQELEQAFGGVPAIGSTSHSEYCNDTFVDDSVSFLILDDTVVEDVDIRVVEDIKGSPDFSGTMAQVHEHFGGVDHILENFDKYVGIVLFEASAKAEESCMDKLGNSTDLIYIGGTSSEKDGYSRVYACGKSYEKAAVLATLKTVSGYQLLKTQSAEVYSPKGYTVTKLDMSTRTMYELDGRPVGEVYAEALGIDIGEISNYFVSNPLGVLADEEIFVRTFDAVQEDGGITVHCGIPEGTEIHILKIGDIIQDTKNALDDTITETPAAVVNFNCLYRTFEILNKNIVPEYCALFGKYPSIGFSTAGEAFLGHINETSTVLILK